MTFYCGENGEYYLYRMNIIDNMSGLKLEVFSKCSGFEVY